MSSLVTNSSHYRQAQFCQLCSAARIVLGDSHVFATQSVIDSDRKIASHLDPVLVLVSPNPKVKTDCSGAKADDIGLGRRLFRNSGLITSNPLQYINHLLRRRTSSDGAGHFDA